MEVKGMEGPEAECSGEAEGTGESGESGYSACGSGKAGLGAVGVWRRVLAGGLACGEGDGTKGRHRTGLLCSRALF